MSGAHNHLNEALGEWLRARYDFCDMATNETAARPAKPRGPLIPGYIWAVIALVVVAIVVALIAGNGSGSSTPAFQPASVAVADVASLPVYSAPNGRVTNQLPNPDPKNYNQKQVFLVQQDKGDWLKVSLPIPPNGQSGWVRTSQVIVRPNSYRVDIARTAHQVRIYKDGVLVKTYPAAIGKADTPTPGGTYFIRVLLQPPNPNGDYGPYAYGLSGYSSVLTTFNGGDGVIGIHGTNEPQVIGTDASHGCIRLRNADITDLVTHYKLQLGTPVRILA
jgi:lipoprotein-anchoring transpeptidase ErfK/SrfK